MTTFLKFLRRIEDGAKVLWICEDMYDLLIIKKYLFIIAIYTVPTNLF
jgi:hypothetical protein